MTQEVLTMATKGNSLRSEAIGWTHDAGATNVRNAVAEHGAKALTAKYVGLVSSQSRISDHSTPATPLHALAEGWKLLAPPSYVGGDDEEYEWWFVREVG